MALDSLKVNFTMDGLVVWRPCCRGHAVQIPSSCGNQHFPRSQNAHTVLLLLFYFLKCGGKDTLVNLPGWQRERLHTKYDSQLYDQKYSSINWTVYIVYCTVYTVYSLQCTVYTSERQYSMRTCFRFLQKIYQIYFASN